MNEIILEKQLAYQCAPLWLDIKLGNTLIINPSLSKCLEQLLYDTKIHYVTLGRIKEKTIFLLYNKEELDCYLHSSRIMQFLLTCGYKGKETDDMLIHLTKRYQSYSNKGTIFPHEIGVFLGYPLEDITGFIENKGKNYLFCGYWKVYNKNYYQKELFNYYGEARKLLLYFINNGIKLTQIK